jgi:hypothetical protein
VPRTSYVYNANRDQLVKPAADKLFALLRADAPVAVAKDLPTDSASGHDLAFDYEEESHGNGKSKGKRPDAPTSVPTFRGNTAAEDACG